MSPRSIPRRALAAAALATSGAAQASLPPSVSILTWSATSLPALRQAFAEHLRATGTPVRHIHLPWGRYLEALPDALHRPDGPDVVWLSDSWLPELVANRSIAPLDAAPGVQRSLAELEPACLQALTVEGRIHGLPYYRDALGLFCNMEMLAAGGFRHPPGSWAELLHQARTLQSRNIVARPLVLPLADEPWLLELLTALVYSFGGGFIGQGGEPVMTRGAAGIVPALTHLQAALHDHRIVPAEALRLTEADCVERMGEGRHAFALLPGHRADWLQHASNAPAASAIRPALMPVGGSVTSSVTCGWLRLQAIPAAAMANRARAERALALLTTLGGRNAEGEHATARRFFVEHGLPFCALPLHEDAAVRAHLQEFLGLRTVLEELAATARPKDTIGPGAALWQSMTNPIWRRVASGAMTPTEAAEAAEAAWRVACRCGPGR